MSEYHPPLRPTPPHGRAIISRTRTITPLDNALIPVTAIGFPLTPEEATQFVRNALDEDQAFNDVSTIATVVSTRHVRSSLLSRGDGVVCGVALAIEAFRQLDSGVTIRVDAEDGAKVQKGAKILSLSGHARGMLSAERVALNFLQHLSGIATLTSRYVDLVRGTGARILDTRKTTPGWRKLEKYAVRAGGGTNHRLDLRSGVLIKDNHLAAVNGDIAAAVSRARSLAEPGVAVQIECENLEQVDAALAAHAESILLDNMELDMLRAAVERCKGRALTEASGGVSLETVRRIAETGVDRISIGALTHSAPALNLSLEFEGL